MICRTTVDLGLEFGVVGYVRDNDIVEIDAFTADSVDFPEEIFLFEST